MIRTGGADPVIDPEKPFLCLLIRLKSKTKLTAAERDNILLNQEIMTHDFMNSRYCMTHKI